MTEEEAKTKWCPYASVVAPEEGNNTGIAAATRFEGVGDFGEWNHARCLGSACMAWRWDTGNPHDTQSKGGILLPRELWPGHCGLAGKP